MSDPNHERKVLAEMKKQTALLEQIAQSLDSIDRSMPETQ